MTDVLSPPQRRLNMSRIRSRNTAPEMIIRRGLHARGLRYLLHDRSLPGSPDLVFPKYRTVAFVNGCFWHAHGCELSKLPDTRRDFWREKLQANTERDRRAIDALKRSGWRVLVVWECALRGIARRSVPEILDMSEHFIKSAQSGFFREIGNLGRKYSRAIRIHN